MPPTDPAIRLDNVAKSFGSRTLFADLSFSIDPGELFVMTGPSGSGKTTLLRIIAGLVSYEGRIRVLGNPVKFGKPTPDLVLIPQQPSLWEHLTALDNVALVRHLLFRESHAHSRRSAMTYLAKLDVAEAAHRYPRALSGGESQRVGLARGLATQREVFLLDEITANIDSARKDIVADLVKVLIANGKTVVMVTHDPEIVRLMGIQPYKLRPGRSDDNTKARA